MAKQGALAIDREAEGAAHYTKRRPDLPLHDHRASTEELSKAEEEEDGAEVELTFWRVGILRRKRAPSLI